MKLLCEEVHKLEAEFEQCRKLLNAIGDENRRHLICCMVLVCPVPEGCSDRIMDRTEGSTGCDAKRIKGDYPGRK